MKEVIPSPFRDCQAHLMRVPDTAEFRGKSYHYINHYYICDESGEEFTDEETGEINSSQIYNQYREENGIPYVCEIIKLREDCQLSKADMGRLLGFGENQYYRYELGEVPSLSNGKLMRIFIDHREELITAIKESTIKECNKEKALLSLHKLITKEDEDKILFSLLFPFKSNIFNGYTIMNVDKVRQMILFFLSKMNTGYKTTLNKLMFYADFLMYKRHSIGISGLTYNALPYGNVPNGFKIMYGLFKEIDEIDAETPYFVPNTDCHMNVFNTDEKEVLEYVADAMTRLSCNTLSEINHKEDAWTKYIHDTKLLIPFSEAFTLKAL